jgi:hypothetical protein
MLKKDNYGLGLLLGAITPVIFYAVFYGIDMLVNTYLGRHMVRAQHYLILLSVIPNLFWIRYYIGRLKFTKTGLTLLLLTMVFIILYFLKFFENPQ